MYVYLIVKLVLENLIYEKTLCSSLMGKDQTCHLSHMYTTGLFYNRQTLFAIITTLSSMEHSVSSCLMGNHTSGREIRHINVSTVCTQTVTFWSSTITRLSKEGRIW